MSRWQLCTNNFTKHTLSQALSPTGVGQPTKAAACLPSELPSQMRTQTGSSVLNGFSFQLIFRYCSLTFHIDLATCSVVSTSYHIIQEPQLVNQERTRIWANAQRDGRPAKYRWRWRPLFNAGKFGWRPLLQCCAVTLPRSETRWN